MVNIQIHTGDLIPPIQSLENYFWNGGVSIIRAAFAHSYFVHPDAVRERTPYYPNRARRSGNHYPGLDKGKHAIWPEDGREVILDVNLRAHQAWERYTGRKLLTRTAYGVRHIWGHPWNPDAFTAGWNLCYMPFWAGMPTEDQHPHPELRDAIKQASWDLYFRDDPVCQPPDFVMDPGGDLCEILDGQPLRVLAAETPSGTKPRRLPEEPFINDDGGVLMSVRVIRTQTHQSWSNICKATQALQGNDHDPFGTSNVEASSKSCVRRILRETGLTIRQLETLLFDNRFC